MGFGSGWTGVGALRSGFRTLEKSSNSFFEYLLNEEAGDDEEFQKGAKLHEDDHVEVCWHIDHDCALYVRVKATGEILANRRAARTYGWVSLG